MIFDKRFIGTILIFLIVSICALLLTFSVSNFIQLAFIIAVTAMSFTFAWLSERKVTPIPFKDGDFRKDFYTLLFFFGLIMLVRFFGYWQDFVFAEKACTIALTISSIVLIDRSSTKYFGVQFRKPLIQILWVILAIAIIWIGFVLYRFGLPLILGSQSTGLVIELPTFDLNFFAYALTLLMWNFSEELFFRGYVLTKLEQSTNFWIALVISSALFGLYHVNYILSYQGTNPLGYILSYVLFCFLFGFGMGLLYKLTKSIITTTLVHAFWNLFFASRYLVPKIYINYGQTSFPLADFDYIFAIIFFILVMFAFYVAEKRKARRCGRTI